MDIKITIRNSEPVTIQSRGETAESWLTNIRRSGNKYTTLNGTAYPTQDILDAVDEKPHKGQANLDGI